ncbi:hypothetical protein F0U60_34135 [Archangium minus]|uniref:Uncharacterized protein n=1 Tax=Archangium minus TaxID=83450 RepID=A0ABY9WZM0_9BACT|nr:hypothetical protein F0U60_34135 [Archangium minus]
MVHLGVVQLGNAPIVARDWAPYDLKQAQAEQDGTDVEEQSRVVATEVRGRANDTLVVSIITLLLLLLPFVPAFGRGLTFFILMPIISFWVVRSGRRARRLTREHGIEVPWRVSLSSGLGWLMLVISLGGWALFGGLVIMERSQKAELRARLEGKLTKASLSPRVACAMLELMLLESKVEGFTILGDFSCEGTLETTATGALLRGAKMKNAGQEEWRNIFACLQSKPAWSIRSLRWDTHCDDSPQGTAKTTVP